MLNDRIRESLQRVGVGRRYYDMRLTDLGTHGDRILDWMGDTIGDAKSKLTDGPGLNLVGGVKKAAPTLHVLTRAVCLLGFDCKLVDLYSLSKQMSKKETDYEFHNYDVLLIYRFYDSDSRDVFEHIDARLDIENLINKRLDEGAVTFLHTTEGVAASRKWWSEDLVNNIIEYNEEFIL